MAGKAPEKIPEKIIDPLRIRQLLARAAAEGAKVQLAVENGDSTHESLVLERDLEREAVVVRLPAPLRPGRADDPAIYLAVVFLKGARAIAFGSRAISAPLHADPRRELHLSLPRRLFIIQRRSEVRIEISPAYDFRVEFGLAGRVAHVRGRLLDLSTRGFSFVAPKGVELTRFPEGGFIRQISLRVHGRTLHFDAQIKNRVSLSHARDAKSEPRRFKIGCRILRIDSDDQDFLLALGVTRLGSFRLK